MNERWTMQISVGAKHDGWNVSATYCFYIPTLYNCNFYYMFKSSLFYNKNSQNIFVELISF